MAHGFLCTCKKCNPSPFDSLFSSGGKKSKGGMHVGRPHTSKKDPKVHVTSTLRNDSGKKIRNDQHHSNLGAIAYGQANYDTRKSRKKG